MLFRKHLWSGLYVSTSLMLRSLERLRVIQMALLTFTWTTVTGNQIQVVCPWYRHQKIYQQHWELNISCVYCVSLIKLKGSTWKSSYQSLKNKTKTNKTALKHQNKTKPNQPRKKSVEFRQRNCLSILLISPWASINMLGSTNGMQMKLT